MRLWSPTDSEFDISLGVCGQCQRLGIVYSASNIDQIVVSGLLSLTEIVTMIAAVQVYRAPLSGPHFLSLTHRTPLYTLNLNVVRAISELAGSSCTLAIIAESPA